MNTKTKKALDAIAVFAILAVLGLATFASAESSLNSTQTPRYYYHPADTNKDLKIVLDAPAWHGSVMKIVL